MSALYVHLLQSHSFSNICTTSTVPVFNSCTRCVGSPDIIHYRTHNRCIDDLTTEWRFDLQILALAIFLSSIGVYSTRHWQTSGRLVQELNVCTVQLCINGINTPHKIEYLASVPWLQVAPP